jgi:hypothetical protein
MGPDIRVPKQSSEYFRDGKIQVFAYFNITKLN